MPDSTKIKKKVYIDVEIACWKRSLDANKISNYLKSNNYKIVNKPENADLIIFVTCAFLNDVAKYWLDKIKEYKKFNTELIIAGCLPDIEKDELKKIFDGKTISTKNLDEIDRLFPGNKIKFYELEDTNQLYKQPTEGTYNGIIKDVFGRIRWLSKVYLTIQDYILKNLFGKNSIEYKFSKKQFLVRISWGCLGNCTYCAIKKAIGTLKSKPINQIIKEFENGLEKGYKNFVLEADDLGAYGIDIGIDFPTLIETLTKIPGKFEITIRGLHPVWICKYADELENILKRGKIPIMDIALQSANSRILKLMNRFSDVNKIKDALLRIKKAYPDLSLSAEIILGFPTETEEEFDDTLSFIEDVNLQAGHIYLFSCKTGTEAENINPKISKENIHERAKRAKDTLKKAGYHVNYVEKEDFIIFSRRA